ncbi:hypothetical protein LZ32DRAFT_614787 [Colletotrichum eremochloae]|nr:hypothetical protein LZ32DRAFT_614787 [Colletotrichum eremochloae]
MSQSKSSDSIRTASKSNHTKTCISPSEAAAGAEDVALAGLQKRVFDAVGRGIGADGRGRHERCKEADNDGGDTHGDDCLDGSYIFCVGIATSKHTNIGCAYVPKASLLAQALLRKNHPPPMIVSKQHAWALVVLLIYHFFDDCDRLEMLPFNDSLIGCSLPGRLSAVSHRAGMRAGSSAEFMHSFGRSIMGTASSGLI